jgi:hypothetical protein
MLLSIRAASHHAYEIKNSEFFFGTGKTNQKIA